MQPSSAPLLQTPKWPYSEESRPGQVACPAGVVRRCLCFAGCSCGAGHVNFLLPELLTVAWQVAVEAAASV